MLVVDISFDLDSLTSIADNAYQQPNPTMYGSDGQTQMYDTNYYQQQYYDPYYYHHYQQQYPVDPMYQGQEQFSEQQQQLPDQQLQDQQLQHLPDQQQYQGHLSPGQQQHHSGFQDPQLLQQPHQPTPEYQIPEQQQPHQPTPEYQVPEQQQPQAEPEHHFQGLPEQSHEHQHAQEHHQVHQLSAHSTPVHGLHLEGGGEMGPAEHQQREPVDGGNDEVSTSMAPSAPSAPIQPDYDDNLQLPMERPVLVRTALYPPDLQEGPGLMVNAIRFNRMVHSWLGFHRLLAKISFTFTS